MPENFDPYFCPMTSKFLYPRAAVGWRMYHRSSPILFTFLWVFTVSALVSRRSNMFCCCMRCRLHKSAMLFWCILYLSCHSLRWLQCFTRRWTRCAGFRYFAYVFLYNSQEVEPSTCVNPMIRLWDIEIYTECCLRPRMHDCSRQYF